jgi:hypothetical protein
MMQLGHLNLTQLGWGTGTRSPNIVASLLISRPRLHADKHSLCSSCVPTFSSSPCYPSKNKSHKDSLCVHYFAGEQGLEPQYHPPEGCVLPLDDSPILILKLQQVSSTLLVSLPLADLASENLELIPQHKKRSPNHKL